MEALLGALTPLFNLLLVIIGFGLVIFIHELGHFLTARWAGIRVYAFALGFGPAALSYRKGMGVRRGSTEPEYIQLVNEAKGGRGESREQARARLAAGMSSTEYRLNVLPFGGYVKMLGQNDLNPDTTVTAPDSYLAKPIWKRMIVISGGVVMNVVLAFAIFMGVFLVGLETEPAKIGTVYPGEPASRALATNAEALGVEETGLRAGDVVLSVNGNQPDEFQTVVMETAMTGPGNRVRLVVAREGYPEPLRFEIEPERSQFTNMLEIGIEPPRTTRIPELPPAYLEQWNTMIAGAGLEGVEPGMRMTRAGDIAPASTADDLREAARRSGGAAFEVEFQDEAGTTVAVSLTPRAQMMLDDANPDPKVVTPLEHLAGLVPVMKVGPLDKGDRGYGQGLREGDIFLRIGEVEFPSLAAGTREVKRHTGREIDLLVLRADETSGELREVAIEATVSGAGLIGFLPDTTGDDLALLALPPPAMTPIEDGAEPYAPAAAGVVTAPGSALVRVGGTEVSNFAEIREALVAASAEAWSGGSDSASVTLAIRLPHANQPGGEPAIVERTLVIPAAQVERLRSLTWDPPFSTRLFEPEVFLLKAEGPIDAIGMGLRRTHQMMVMTYLTLARLVQGTVEVESLKGPVGIAHLGTQVASRGYIWLIFFMGLISINLAVVNFLPLPIADGGQFILLLYEQIRGRPLAAPLQNAISAAGLVLFVSLFLIITFNDVARLFGG